MTKLGCVSNDNYKMAIFVILHQRKTNVNWHQYLDSFIIKFSRVVTWEQVCFWRIPEKKVFFRLNEIPGMNTVLI